MKKTVIILAITITFLALYWGNKQSKPQEVATPTTQKQSTPAPQKQSTPTPPPNAVASNPPPPSRQQNLEQKSSIRIEGRILDEFKEPIENAAVRINDGSPIKTQKDGRFTLKGQYTYPMGLVVSATGYGSATRYLKPEEGQYLIQLEDITLNAEFFLGGQVIDESGNPVAQVPININSSQGLHLQSATSNNEGHFLFEGLPRGSQLVAAAPGYLDTRLTDLPKNVDDFRVILRQTRSFFGQVRDESEKIITTFDVTYSGQTIRIDNPEGIFQIDNLHPQETIYMEVSADGYFKKSTRALVNRFGSQNPKQINLVARNATHKITSSWYSSTRGEKFTGQAYLLPLDQPSFFNEHFNEKAFLKALAGKNPFPHLKNRVVDFDPYGNAQIPVSHLEKHGTILFFGDGIPLQEVRNISGDTSHLRFLPSGRLHLNINRNQLPEITHVHFEFENMIKLHYHAKKNRESNVRFKTPITLSFPNDHLVLDNLHPGNHKLQLLDANGSIKYETTFNITSGETTEIELNQPFYNMRGMATLEGKPLGNTQLLLNIGKDKWQTIYTDPTGYFEARRLIQGTYFLALRNGIPQPNQFFIPVHAGLNSHQIELVDGDVEGHYEFKQWSSVSGQLINFPPHISVYLSFNAPGHAISVSIPVNPDGSFYASPIPPGQVTLEFLAHGKALKTMNDIMIPVDGEHLELGEIVLPLTGSLLFRLESVDLKEGYLNIVIRNQADQHITRGQLDIATGELLISELPAEQLEITFDSELLRNGWTITPKKMTVEVLPDTIQEQELFMESMYAMIRLQSNSGDFTSIQLIPNKQAGRPIHITPDQMQENAYIFNPFADIKKIQPGEWTLIANTESKEYVETLELGPGTRRNILIE